MIERRPVSQDVFDKVTPEQRQYLVIDDGNPLVLPAMPSSVKVQASVSESDFQRTLVEFLQVKGWLVHAERHARTKDGKWMTPIQGDKGFPDLIATKGTRLIVAELKSDTGRVSFEQYEWLETLGKSVAVYIWRPSDWEQIEEIIG